MVQKAVSSVGRRLRSSWSVGHVCNASLSPTSGRRAVTSGAQGLPSHALRVTGEFGGDPRTRKYTLLPLLQGRLKGPGGASEIAQAIRDSAPRQVLIELCARRYAEVLECAVTGVPCAPPPRVDILGNVHGGLLAHELVPIIQAAREVGAAIVPVDRAKAATRSRVAQYLWQPKLMQGLLSYGATSLKQRNSVLPFGAEALRFDLLKTCPAAHEVLIQERCMYMAHQVRSVGIPEAEVMIVCSALHLTAVADALQRSPKADAADQFLSVARRGVPIWPILVVIYVVAPGALLWYFASWAWDSFVAPSLMAALDA